MALQFRRGTDSDRLTITPTSGEPIFTSDTKQLFVGDGSTAGGISLTGNLGSVSGNIVPDTDSTYDIGSPTRKFKSLYLSGNSIFLGDGLVLSNNGGVFAVTDSDNTPVTISLANNNTSSLTEGTNLYYTTARGDSDAKNSISVTDVGGDGSITYNSTTGVISYTGPSASEVRAHFSAGGDLTYNSSTGQFSINVETVYSKANFDSDLGDANSGQLPEGTNLYYTTSRANSDAGAYLTTNSYATQTYVNSEINSLIGGAPGTLDTLNEIAAALNNDDSAYSTLVGLISAKSDLDSSAAISLIDSSYVQARQTTYDFLDSSEAISLIDSSYIQARQTTAASGNDSATTIALIDASYIQARQTTYDFLDSAEAISLIDSSYIQARTTAGTDSAATISLIGTTVDSAYVSARAFLSIDSDLTTTDSAQIIHSFSKTTYRTVKYIAQLNVASSGYHAEELLLTHNGTNIAITSYAKLLLDSDLGIFDAQINGSNVELTLTPTKANTNVKLKAIPAAP